MTFNITEFITILIDKLDEIIEHSMDCEDVSDKIEKLNNAIKTNIDLNLLNLKTKGC